MLHAIKKFVPNSWLDTYHQTLSVLADSWYGHPSDELIVVGVTGTNGKTTTSYMIAKALEAGGTKTGCMTTAIYKIADKEWLNNTKMTMLGRFALQKMLRQMVSAGCRYAVVETSSQGIIQHRHEHIRYDVCAFTNLTPEHIEAHGGFENYKKAKLDLFIFLKSLPEKKIANQLITRAAVLNRDDQYADEFAAKSPSTIVWYGESDRADVKLADINETVEGVSFKVSETQVNLKMMGKVNAYNAVCALAVVQSLGLNLSAAARELEKIQSLPGHFEKIEQGQPWTVMVDYAPEPESFRKLYETIKVIPRNRVIHVMGSCGGGRDVARRPILGKLAAHNADIVIVTNEDPYDDNPQQIIEQVAVGVREGGKIEGHNLFMVADRKQAIHKAMKLAQPNDLVLLTGKGCEQFICLEAGRKMPWDEREEVKKAINEVIAKQG